MKKADEVEKLLQWDLVLYNLEKDIKFFYDYNIPWQLQNSIEQIHYIQSDITGRLNKIG